MLITPKHEPANLAEEVIALMIWTKYNLAVVDIYGMKTISFTNMYNSFIAKMMKQGYRKILDLCCGYGQHSLDLAKKGFHVTALDSDQKKLNYLSNLSENYNYHIDIINADMKNTFLQSSSYDAILCLSAIHHQTYYNIIKTFDEIYRLLIPNGLFLFDILSIEDITFGVGIQIEHNTFVGSRAGEENVPHHYTTENEIGELLSSYRKYSLNANEYELQYNNDIINSRFYDVIAIK